MLAIQKISLPRLLVAVTAMFMFALAGPAADAQTRSVKETDYKDWRVRCEKVDESKPEQCLMFQDVKNSKNEQVTLLSIAIRYPAPGEAPLAFIRAPLGVYLPPGMSMTIDGTAPLQLPFEFCNQSGCHTRLKIENDLLAELKKGQRIEFSVLQFPSGQKHDGTASLNGFTAAVGALK